MSNIEVRKGGGEKSECQTLKSGGAHTFVIEFLTGVFTSTFELLRASIAYPAESYTRLPGAGLAGRAGCSDRQNAVRQGAADVRLLAGEVDERHVGVAVVALGEIDDLAV